MVWSEERLGAAETGNRLVSWDERRGVARTSLPKAKGVEFGQEIL